MTDTTTGNVVSSHTGLPLNSSEYLSGYLGNVTRSANDDVGGTAALLPIEFVVVLVLAAACVLVGVIYAYVHFTRAARARIEKRKRRPSSVAAHHHHHHHVNSMDEGSRQTHLMFFRRTTTS